jgi:hypothetical protein
MMRHCPRFLMVGMVAMLCAGIASGCGAARENDGRSTGTRVDHSPSAEQENGASRTDVDTGPDTVADTVAAMTDRQLVGQLVVTKLEGTSLSADEQRALTRGELGGVILHAHSCC